MWMNRKIGILFLMVILLAPVMTVSAQTGLIFARKTRANFEYFEDAKDQFENYWYDESKNPVILLKGYEFEKGSSVQIFVFESSGKLVFWAPQIFLASGFDYINVIIGGKRFSEGPKTYYIVVRINGDSGTVDEIFTFDF
jgi:hypothetical protein